MTINKLKEHAVENCWNASEVDTDSVILVCPNLDGTLSTLPDSTFQRRTGWWVVGGIKKFPGLPQNVAIDRKSQGLVVNHDTGEKSLIPYNAVCLPSRGG